MIISHKNQFIFIKTRKTAGTTLEIALSSICGPEDVITPFMIDKDERLRSKFSDVGPQNYRNLPGAYGTPNLDPKKAPFYNHMPAAEVRGKIGEKIWNSYFKFTVVREPLDRAISFYYWARRSHGREAPASFSLFLRQYASQIYENWMLYTENNKICLDKVVYFENLTQEMNQVSRDQGWGVDFAGALSDIKAKGDVRPKNKESIKPSMSDRVFIYLLCQQEYDALNYSIPLGDEATIRELGAIIG
jgi:hypothetical protein